ncbi:hypothetical protein [Massilia sp. CCM 8734]|uniref:hypothetical protein n=1 Tax=Massilia sp. CCM 8734 TaxID=2609283 RepID=UPI0014220140|nr:hypothetical protein [Massilia sp. CCM 8734]NIA00799.1 hypothetical protein [Massilia sp. CCM 8734]
MSAVAIMRALLVAHAPLIALVPAARIAAGTVPSGALPAIGITEISGNEQDTVARTGNSLVTSRVQVTVYAASYPQQKDVLKAARLGAGVHTGLIADYVVRSVLRDLVGPDMGDPAVPTFEQSRDFMVTYIEPA